MSNPKPVGIAAPGAPAPAADTQVVLGAKAKPNVGAIMSTQVSDLHPVSLGTGSSATPAAPP